MNRGREETCRINTDEPEIAARGRDIPRKTKTKIPTSRSRVVVVLDSFELDDARMTFAIRVRVRVPCTCCLGPMLVYRSGGRVEVRLEIKGTTDIPSKDGDDGGRVG